MAGSPTFLLARSKSRVSPNKFLPKCLRTRPSAPSASSPRRPSRTARSPSGSVCVLTTPSSTTPSVATGVAPSSACKRPSFGWTVLLSRGTEWTRSLWTLAGCSSSFVC